MEQHTSDQLAGTQGTSQSISTRKIGQCHLLCRSGHEYKDLAAHNRTLMHIRAAAKQPIPSSPRNTSVPPAPDLENLSKLAQHREGHHNTDPVIQDHAEPQERPMITTELAVPTSTDPVILTSEAVGEGQCPALCREGHHYKHLVKHNQTKLHKHAMITLKLAVAPAPHDGQVVLTSQTVKEGQCSALCRGGHHYKNLTTHNRTEAHSRAIVARLEVLANGDSTILTLETVKEGQCPALCRGGHHYRNLITHNRTALHKRAMATRSQRPEIAKTVGVSSAFDIPVTPDAQTAREGPCRFLCRNSFHYKNLRVHNRTVMHQSAAMKEANLSPASLGYNYHDTPIPGDEIIA